MKSICRSFVYILTITLLLTACNKKEPAMPTPSVVKMTFRGYSFYDTLEVVKGKELLATLRANSSFEVIALIAINNDKEQLGLRKKGTTEIISTIDVNRTPFQQNKKIFFDGKTVSDKVEVTPVSNPENIGFRLWFTTDFPYFYGGPVDFAISKLTYDNITYDFSFTPVKTIKNVGNTFSEFIELPLLTSTEQETSLYTVRVFKAGTTELPYKEGVDLSALPEPQFYYCSIDGLKAGQSALFKLSPFYSGEKYLRESFVLEDIASPFR
jgi:hypothetical protein